MFRSKNPSVGKRRPHGPANKSPPRKMYRSQVRIEEPNPTQNPPVKKPTEKGKQAVTGKGKEKVQSSPRNKRPQVTDSDTDTDSVETEILRRAAQESKKAHLKKKQKTGNTSSAPTDFPELNLPFLDADLDEGVNKLRYNKFFREKRFCPTVAVDLEALKYDPDFKLDLTSVFGRFENWLRIKEEYCPAVVRRFFCNMDAVQSYSNVEFLVPSRISITTSLRGRKIVITKELINKILEITPDNDEPLPPMTVAEAQRILLQKDQAEPLIKKFRPSKMCDRYRIIHYIVSRSIINKSHSFTYLSQEDCVLLARIIRGDKLDIAELIFNLLKEYTSNKMQTEAFIPIPQIVSFMLKKLNIAHLEGEEKKQIDTFDMSFLKRMKLDLPYDPSRSMLPPEKKKKAEPSEDVPEDPQDEAQSSAAPPPPSQFTVELATKLDSIFSSLKTELAEMKTSQSAIFVSLESELAEVKSTQNVILENQNRMQHEIDDIKNLVLHYINKSFGPSISEEDLDKPTEQPEASTPVQSPALDPVPEPPSEQAPETAPSPKETSEPTPAAEPEPSSKQKSESPAAQDVSSDSLSSAKTAPSPEQMPESPAPELSSDPVAESMDKPEPVTEPPLSPEPELSLSPSLSEQKPESPADSFDSLSSPEPAPEPSPKHSTKLTPQSAFQTASAPIIDITSSSDSGSEPRSPVHPLAIVPYVPPNN